MNDHIFAFHIFASAAHRDLRTQNCFFFFCCISNFLNFGLTHFKLTVVIIRSAHQYRIVMHRCSTVQRVAASTYNIVLVLIPTNDCRCCAVLADLFFSCLLLPFQFPFNKISYKTMCEYVCVCVFELWMCKVWVEREGLRCARGCRMAPGG